MITKTEFIDRSVKSAADLALLFAGEPDSKVASTLATIRANLETQLSEPLGPDIAVKFAAGFVEAVAGRRREIECAGASGWKQQLRQPRSARRRLSNSN
jgi:hypothetical protein